MVAIVLAGYVLLFEENEWLKKNVVKAIALMVFFDLIAVVCNLLPNAITFINSVVAIFGGKFSIAVLTKVVTAITNGFSIVEKVLFIGLGLKALNQGSISFKAVDKVVN